MRWPRSGEPSALSPQVPVVSGACRGRSPRPACFPSLQSRPCHTCCCLRPGSAASLGRGWALPPLARHLEAPPEAARLSGPREPAPGPWGSLPRGREAPPGTRKGGFLCSVLCKSGLGWALPGRTSCVCCLLITGSVSEQTGGRGRAGGCGGAGRGTLKSGPELDRGLGVESRVPRLSSEPRCYLGEGWRPAPAPGLQPRCPHTLAFA